MMKVASKKHGNLKTQKEVGLERVIEGRKDNGCGWGMTQDGGEQQF